MTQQNLVIGAADAGGGDTAFEAFTKIQANFTDLYDVSNEDSAIFVGAEADFPTQDATTITLDAGTPYVLTAPITTAKRFIVERETLLTGRTLYGNLLTYTGTNAMFTVTDGSFQFDNLLVTCPTAKLFDVNYAASGGGQVVLSRFRTLACAQYGTFNNTSAILINIAGAFDCDQGIVLSGSGGLILALSQFNMISTSPTFKGLDLGATSWAIAIELSNFVTQGPSGAFGISGLASSGNLAANRLAMVSVSEAVGGLTPLENITVDDVRWLFKDNTGYQNTFRDALIYFRSNSTDTVITTASTPVLVAGTWIEERSSQFTTTAAGRITFNAELTQVFPVDVSFGLVAATGGAGINIRVYIAVNGSIISAASIAVTTDSSTSRTGFIPWQLELSQNDYIEIWLENNTNTTDVTVEDITVRIN